MSQAPSCPPPRYAAARADLEYLPAVGSDAWEAEPTGTRASEAGGRFRCSRGGAPVRAATLTCVAVAVLGAVATGIVLVTSSGQGTGGQEPESLEAPEAPEGAGEYADIWAASTGSQSCSVVKEYPHNPSSFTQGLEAIDASGDGAAWLEGTGLYGKSKLLRVSSSGEVMASQELSPSLFGEGVTEVDGTVYQLTWKEDTLIWYNASTLKELGRATGVIGQFQRKEGWGLTDDGEERLIASDGSDKIYFLSLKNLSLLETVTIPGLDPSGARIWGINELEYANGFLFFNAWHKPWIGVFDLDRRKLSWLDCSDLVKNQFLRNKGANVFNGIAFLPSRMGKPRRMVVTGKMWDRLYEIDYELPALALAQQGPE